MQPVLRRTALVVVACIAVLDWVFFMLVHAGDCPTSFSAGEGRWVLGILVGCGIAAWALGDRRITWRIGLALIAMLAIGAWSINLLAHTRYLEPLPWTAGALGVLLLVVAAFGAGLLSGWQWLTLLVLPAAAIGFFHLSESLWNSGVECFPQDAAVVRGLVLLPVAIIAGAFVARSVPKPAFAAGAVLLLLPFVVLGWAAYRHTHPIDHRSTNPPELAWDGNKLRVNGVFGEGREHREIGPALSKTAVGVGDSLVLARRRIPSAQCFIPLHGFDPGCEVSDRTLGLIWINGDPITSIASE